MQETRSREGGEERPVVAAVFEPGRRQRAGDRDRGGDGENAKRQGALGDELRAEEREDARREAENRGEDHGEARQQPAQAAGVQRGDACEIAALEQEGERAGVGAVGRGGEHQCERRDAARGGVGADRRGRRAKPVEGEDRRLRYDGCGDAVEPERPRGGAP